MIFNCPDCGKEVDTSCQFRKCGPFGHEPCVPIDDGMKHKFVEAKKTERAKRGFQSDFYQVGWGESQIPYSARRNQGGE